MPRRQLTTAELGPSFPARYPGKCWWCGDAFGVGDLIAKIEGGWACDNCAVAWRLAAERDRVRRSLGLR